MNTHYLVDDTEILSIDQKYFTGEISFTMIKSKDNCLITILNHSTHPSSDNGYFFKNYKSFNNFIYDLDHDKVNIGIHYNSASWQQVYNFLSLLANEVWINDTSE